MPPLARYLPAFLVLLVPLAVLAYLGSHELSRLQERAELMLRERAFDVLDAAVERFDQGIEECFEAALEGVVARHGPDLYAMAQAVRRRRAVAELYVWDSRGRLRHPREPPSPGEAVRHCVPRQAEAAFAQQLALLDDDRGALEALAPGLDGGGDAISLLDQARAELQLAALQRHRGELDAAPDAYRRAAALLSEEREQAREWKRSHPQTLALLCQAGLAEVELELSPGRSDFSALLELLQAIGGGDFAANPDALLAAAFDRAVRALPAGHGANPAIAAARQQLTAQIAARDRARAYDRLLESRLRKKLLQAPRGGRVLQVIERDLSTDLLIARHMTESEAALLKPGFLGIAIDVTAFGNQVLAPFLAPGEDGFTIDVRADGRAVLRQRLPDGSRDGELDPVSQMSSTGLQLAAIPRNARAQLDARRASARNQALLVLALCLLAGGGALLLVRSVGRESELASMKVGLVSRVSHELRTPLAMIKMYGDTLGMGRARDPEQAARFAGIISREADRLTLLINRILDFARQQRGDVTYRRETVDLGALVDDVAADYRTHLSAAGLELDADLGTGVMVNVDTEAMAGVVVNLLENAAKYTPAEAADRTIRIELRRDGGRAVLDVLDRGAGIPVAERRKVFESFYRATTAGEVRGAGLGLSLVRHFAEAHGGNVQALAREGGGTVLRITLPLGPRRLR